MISNATAMASILSAPSSLNISPLHTIPFEIHVAVPSEEISVAVFLVDHWHQTLDPELIANIGGSGIEVCVDSKVFLIVGPGVVVEEAGPKVDIG